MDSNRCAVNIGGAESAVSFAVEADPGSPLPGARLFPDRLDFFEQQRVKAQTQVPEQVLAVDFATGCGDGRSAQGLSQPVARAPAAPDSPREGQHAI
jgi:hypothetical protein